jgi:hypothetical protein
MATGTVSITTMREFLPQMNRLISQVEGFEARARRAHAEAAEFSMIVRSAAAALNGLPISPASKNHAIAAQRAATAVETSMGSAVQALHAAEELRAAVVATLRLDREFWQGFVEQPRVGARAWTG